MGVPLETFATVAAIMESLATVIAVAIAGAWAYRKYCARREHLCNLNVEPTATATIAGEKRALLGFEFRISNIGSRVFIPGNKGLEITVRRITTPDLGEVEWSAGTEVFGPNDILAKYKHGQEGYVRGEMYALDAGASYIEKCYIVVQSNELYMVQSRLHTLDGDSLTDYFLIDTRRLSSS